MSGSRAAPAPTLATYAALQALPEGVRAELIAGAVEVWLVDPSARTLEALRLDAGVWIELGVWGDGDLARIEPFAAVELEVSRLFPPPAAC